MREPITVTVSVAMDGEVMRVMECGNAAPTLQFVGNWRLGRPPEQLARDGTGRDITTGELRLTITIRHRNNGLVRFTCDLWKLPHDLSPDALARLRNYWELEHRAIPERVRARMERHFSRTHFVFDTTQEQAGDWRDFLATALTDAASYTNYQEVRP